MNNPSASLPQSEHTPKQVSSPSREAAPPLRDFHIFLVTYQRVSWGWSRRKYFVREASAHSLISKLLADRDHAPLTLLTCERFQGTGTWALVVTLREGEVRS